jgi:hypothetical protein
MKEVAIEEEEEEDEVEVEDGKVFGVLVHHADYLPLGDHNLLHPSVKVTYLFFLNLQWHHFF